MAKAKAGTRKGWPRQGFYSKAHWRYYFAIHHPAARKLARATPGGKGRRYRRLPGRRPGPPVTVNARGNGFVLKRRPTHRRRR